MTLIFSPTNVIEFLLYPEGGESFREHLSWVKPKFVKRNNTKYYDMVSSSAELEHLLNTRTFTRREIRIVRQGMDAPSEFLKNDGVANRDVVSNLFSDGYSIVLHALDRILPGLQELSSSLGVALSSRINVNAYWTPANAQALEAHYDNHDVFVLQLTGSKEWRLYDLELKYPLDGTIQPPFHPDSLPTPKKLILNGGDLLYVPRGFIHDANATSEDSLHLTVGVHPTQWVDFISTALYALSLKHEELRAPLPVGFLNDVGSIDHLQQEMMSICKTLIPMLSSEDAFSVIQDTHMRNSADIIRNQFIEQGDINNGVGNFHRFRRRENIYNRLIFSKEQIALQFGSCTVACPRSYKSALEYISTIDEPFRVTDVPEISNERSQRLIAKLLSEGFLVGEDPLNGI